MAKKEQFYVEAPNFNELVMTIKGAAPYVQHKFSQKSREQMKAAQELGDKKKSVKKREPKNFEQCYKDAMHVSTEGWHGIPATAFRNAMISACRIAGVTMTRAKLAIFVEADGFDDDGTPLIRITKGSPKPHEMHVRVGQGSNPTTDIRVRPMWEPGWEAVVRVRFDADFIDGQQVVNLMMRVGKQVGIGEGRPDSRSGNGMGWGLFEIFNEEEKEVA